MVVKGALVIVIYLDSEYMSEDAKLFIKFEFDGSVH